MLQQGHGFSAVTPDQVEQRLTWWRGGTDRLCRINLESKQLDVLVAQEIVDWIGETSIVARLKSHDSNALMREAFARNPSEANALVRVFAYPVSRTKGPI